MSRVVVDATTTTGDFTVSATFTADGGVTALFGPSGAGKSVTLATVAGLLRPSEGTVVLHGETVAAPARRLHVRTQDRHVGMVFQHGALLPHRSPLDNVALAVREGGDRAARRARAVGWLDRVHAGHLASAATATLSGGEQQRVALARALAGGPRVLLLDEPFSALDQPARLALRCLVGELIEEHDVTALLVTHDLDDITALASRVVLFEPGRTVATRDLGPEPAVELAKVLGLAS